MPRMARPWNKHKYIDDASLTRAGREKVLIVEPQFLSRQRDKHQP